MKKLKLLAFITILSVAFLSCGDEKDLSQDLAGLWKQDEVLVDGTPAQLNDCEKEVTLLLEANGVYRMFDTCSSMEHSGTWIFSDKEWLNMSMDKITGMNSSDGTYRYGQVLVRFTILNVDNSNLEIRIKTTLGERKKTIQFTQMIQDTIVTGEQALLLDTKNKEMHSYIYRFKKMQL